MEQAVEQYKLEEIDGMLVTGVTSDLFPDAWPFVKDHLYRGLEHSYGELGLDDIYDAIKDRRMQLWIAVERGTDDIVASMVTEIVQYPKIKVARLVVVGGTHLEDWCPFMNSIMDWAKSKGCTRVEGWARDGWVKVLKEYGFKKLYNLVAVDIEEKNYELN